MPVPDVARSDGRHDPDGSSPLGDGRLTFAVAGGGLDAKEDRGPMEDRLHRCGTDDARVSWVIRRLKDGRSVDDASLWLAGVVRPMRLIGRTRSALREQGLHVRSAMRAVADASGRRHEALCWSLEPGRRRAAT